MATLASNSCGRSRIGGLGSEVVDMLSTGNVESQHETNSDTQLRKRGIDEEANSAVKAGSTAERQPRDQ
jgi:hypothetical protein